MVKTEKSSWEVKKSEEKKEKMFRLRSWLCSMWSNIKIVVEEHLSSENVHIGLYLHSTGRWSDDEVAMYLLTYHQQTN